MVTYFQVSVAVCGLSARNNVVVPVSSLWLVVVYLRLVRCTKAVFAAVLVHWGETIGSISTAPLRALFHYRRHFLILN